MPQSVHLGEFEHLVMLTILKLGSEAYAIDIRNSMIQRAGRSVSRGALYRTFDRLRNKGYLTWEVEAEAGANRSFPRRRFAVTPAGIAILRAARYSLLDLWDGLEEVLA